LRRATRRRPFGLAGQLGSVAKRALIFAAVPGQSRGRGASRSRRLQIALHDAASFRKARNGLYSQWCALSFWTSMHLSASGSWTRLFMTIREIHSWPPPQRSRRGSTRRTSLDTVRSCWKWYAAAKQVFILRIAGLRRPICGTLCSGTTPDTGVVKPPNLL
jgi:hypothetical protein